MISALSPITVSDAKASATTIYFSQSHAGGRLNRMPLAGGGVEVLEQGESLPFGVAVDAVGEMVYMASPSNNAVYRRPLHGSGPPELLIDGLATPIDITLDVRRDAMYFTDRGNGAIKRAKLDGTNVETLVSIFGQHFQYLDLDPLHEKLYWTDSRLDRVYRANTDGSQVEILFDRNDWGGASPRGIVLDPLDQAMYLALGAEGRILKADLDGGNPEDVVSGLAKVPLDVALDFETHRLYWSVFDGILWTDLGGDGTVHTLVSGLQGGGAANGVNGIALDQLPIPEPSTGLLLALGLAVLAVQRTSLLNW